MIKSMFRCRNTILPDMILVEKDILNSDEECGIIHQLNWKPNGSSVKFPKLILLATNIATAELDKARAAGFADTVIMKPLRATMVAACLQQVLGVKNQRRPNGSAFLQSLLCGKRILIVDDNRVNRRVAAGALKKFGADVECADSGKSALKLLQLPHNFDACFMDIQMPEMDGYVLTTLHFSFGVLA